MIQNCFVGRDHGDRLVKPSLQMFSLETDDTIGVDMGKLCKKSGIWMRSCKAIIREEHAVFAITKPAR